MLKTLLKQVKQYSTSMILTPVWTAMEVLMGILIPYVTASLIDKGVMAGNMNCVYRYGLMMMGIACMSLVFGILAGRFAAYSSTGFAANLREAMYTNIQRFSFSDIDKYSTAGLITRMTTDVSSIEKATQMLLRISFRAPLNMISALVMCLFINRRLSVIFLVAMLFLTMFLYIIISRTARIFKQVFEKYDNLNAVIMENISAIRVVKAYVRESHEYNKFDKAIVSLYSLESKAERLMALNHPIMNLTVNACIIAISWWGAHFIVDGSLTTGQLTSLFAYVTTILGSLMMLSRIFIELTESAASAARISQVICEEPDMDDPNVAMTTVRDGSIDFDHVSFSYKAVGYDTSNLSKGDYALEDINLHINDGETIGIIGGTGSGKSTLASLICRLYDVSAGSVKVGGFDVRDYSMEALRKQIAIVLQKNTLFSGTIYDNLRWGREDATDEECREACRLACADEFIEAFPDGYNTHIEQGGVNVSGGQRQRICIAQALLKRPKILILDNSTSAVDTATDRRIRDTFSTRIPGVTKIIVSQRILSIQDADRIIVMEQGRINGFDTHENLLRDNEIYRDIHEMQTSGGEADFDEKEAKA